MSNTVFDIGDVVHLKSGGPKMTITSILSEEEQERIGGKYTTAWFNKKNNLKRSFFDEYEIEFAADE